jgi:hypothetical protein
MPGPEMMAPMMMKGASSMMGGKGGGGGGMGGGKGGGGAGSGPSPEQAALAQYTYGENLIKNRASFNMGPSTMESMAAAGSKNQWALQMAQAGDQNMAAQNQAGSQLSQLANQQGQQQQGNQDFASGFGSTQSGGGGNTQASGF